MPPGTEGEICMRGRHRFMGYFKNDKSTQETIDENGFLHSGDLGIMDERGFLKITGRIKELIITAGGENIAPVLIEDMVKEKCPIISNIQVIGDNKPYLSALVTLKVEIEDHVPGDRLTSEVTKELSSIGVNVETVGEAVKNPEVIKYCLLYTSDAADE